MFFGLGDFCWIRLLSDIINLIIINFFAFLLFVDCWAFELLGLFWWRWYLALVVRRGFVRFGVNILRLSFVAGKFFTGILFWCQLRGSCLVVV